MSQHSFNPYESSSLVRATEPDWRVRYLGLAIAIYVLAAWAASWAGTAMFVGAENVFMIWKMQPIFDHLIQWSIFLLGGVGSFFAMRFLVNVHRPQQHIWLSMISGAAFGAMPYAFEPLIEKVPTSVIADAGRWFDSVPLAITSTLFFVVATSLVLVGVWLTRLIGRRALRCGS
ncbi:hypothetical protein LOC67_17185 [Stieleria sp. JC731]|uniref:hypothetical protein n=1 Tax=Pirellulaceae TaxID=2691357 RepID=UPI001E36B452|nr:hypothetical protein [Stieleria sp. JC731]MCC9602291.1 hypothetical protein [Stieleria sp. JC731]